MMTSTSAYQLFPHWLMTIVTVTITIIATGLPGLNAASASVSARFNINEPTGSEPGSAELSANVIVLTTNYNGVFDVDNSAGKLIFIYFILCVLNIDHNL